MPAVPRSRGSARWTARRLRHALTASRQQFFGGAHRVLHVERSAARGRGPGRTERPRLREEVKGAPVHKEQRRQRQRVGEWGWITAPDRAIDSTWGVVSSNLLVMGGRGRTCSAAVLGVAQRPRSGAVAMEGSVRVGAVPGARSLRCVGSFSRPPNQRGIAVSSRQNTGNDESLRL